MLCYPASVVLDDDSLQIVNYHYHHYRSHFLPRGLGASGLFLH